MNVKSMRVDLSLRNGKMIRSQLVNKLNFAPVGIVFLLKETGEVLTGETGD